MRKALITLSVLVAAAGACGAAGAATPRSTVTPQISANWSGYALVPTGTDPLTFTDVTGTWVQPKAKCTSGRTDASAFWVGLGGYGEGSNALEQLGTAAQCDGTDPTPTNYAWWEVVPAASVQIPMKVKPGDTITAAVLVQDQTVTFSLRDVTRNERFSKKITTSEELDVSSAEWIAEAPSDCGAFGSCRVIPLTNFGRITFTKAAAIGNSHPGTILDGTWTASPIELLARDDSTSFFGDPSDIWTGVGAVPTDVSSDGRSFEVSWANNLSPTG
ncbi:MAG TPA: G1 family glutamic endopeptidase [Gaiellaceae bacterium]|nr:G1 family glutamic endopeptidase [Gaiellaceae bacterium]